MPRDPDNKRNLMQMIAPDPYCDRCGNKLTDNKIFYRNKTICPRCSDAISREVRKPSLTDQLYAAELRRHKLGIK